MELEAEVAKLKELNQELQKKQVVLLNGTLTCLIHDNQNSLFIFSSKSFYKNRDPNIFFLLIITIFM